jgi:hypothetical protein
VISVPGQTYAAGARGLLARAGPRLASCLISTLFTALGGPETFAGELSPARMARIGAVDERFQSYNVEMVEVTGGRFWKPYGPAPSDPHSDLYAYRAPIDLTNARLRKLAAALAPAYIRVSGSWANATYFANSDAAPPAPPHGFNGMLTRRQWRGVIDFSQAVGARIVTSFAVSPGTRDATGAWIAGQASSLLGYTASVGGHIAAAEFMNEPDVAAMGAAAASDDVAAYRRDFRIFRSLMKQQYPGIMILGPGTVSATNAASDLVAGSGSGVDVVSYHHYGALSERCGATTTPEAAMSEAWLSMTEQTLAFYVALRDKFEPGKPIWLTETAEAACGGNRWAATFLDTFRYLDQLGRLAKGGVQVVMHNTLAASDYGLLDEKTLTPRPNYWGALLWRKLMGDIVLGPAVPVEAGLHVYAHCQRGMPGGVTLLVINSSRDAPRSLTLPDASERYTLDAANPGEAHVRLNGEVLDLNAQGDLPLVPGLRTAAGALIFAPATITFLTMAASNSAC